MWPLEHMYEIWGRVEPRGGREGGGAEEQWKRLVTLSQGVESELGLPQY